MRTGERPLSFGEALRAELEALEYTGIPDLGGDGALRRLFSWMGAHARDLSALCLSGGGIRSATFNLGVLQGLARVGVLGDFHYLSSVSGGGFIAAWFRTWIHREIERAARTASAVEAAEAARSAREGVLRRLAGSVPEARDPLAPEPDPIDRLREYGNYLTPRLGIVSADGWTALAIVLRSLLAIWLVIVPVLAAVVMVPQVFLVAMHAPVPPAVALGTLGVAFAGALVGTASGWRLQNEAWSVQGARRERVESPPERSDDDMNRMQRAIRGRLVRSSVLPFTTGAIALALAAWWLEADRLGWDWVGERWKLAFVAGWCVAVPVLGWGWAWLRVAGAKTPAQRAKELGVVLLAGGAEAAALKGALDAGVLSTPWSTPGLHIAAVPLALLLLRLAARTVFVALVGRTDRDPAREDLSREWWARHSALLLMAAASWFALAAIALLGRPLLWVNAGPTFRWAQRALAVVTIVGTALLGKSAFSSSGRDNPADGSPKLDLLLRIAAPLGCAGVLAVLSWAAGEIIEPSAGFDLAELAWPPCIARPPEYCPEPTAWRTVLYLAGGALGAAGIGWLIGFGVNANRFSLHGLYRNRLVRAYLGASHRGRDPDPFTGFDTRDDLPLAALDERRAGAGLSRPLPIVNTTLNIVRGARLAWQERKAESFSMTPLHCGNFHNGYRPSDAYAEGISLGGAIAISGAAANPNMGYVSSTPAAFLMTLFNSRLGVWLGNTGDAGARTFGRSAPGNALTPLFAELTANTRNDSAWVNLSDGGHFDNLGLYEVVLRRCRFVLVSDAGRDPACGFEDLGNAIRKIRIDFGIPIEFQNRIDMRPRPKEGDIPPRAGAHCAVGTIRYSAADRDARDGVLVYLKPGLSGGEHALPYDVYSYARHAPAFPHEPTRDQFFSEAQFESYRALGEHVIAEIAGTAALDVPPGQTRLDALLAKVKAYLASAAASAGPPV